MENLHVVDVRGLACPQPVIRTKQAMKNNRKLTVFVSQSDQVNNVKRMVERAGWSVIVEDLIDYIKLTLVPGSLSAEPVILPEDTVCPTGIPVTCSSRGLLVIASEYMGSGDDKLGKLLMKAFVNTIDDLDTTPEKILLVNSGVKLALKDSSVLDSLIKLEDKGVDVLVCGTCLDFFHVKDELSVGIVSNMYDIAGSMLDIGVTY
ncbi:sulfurtransferase-like selenium metabolism protein YedF, partial [bacterium]|nr:sulfurtransferase-like selenium metabolism protein YedF [bacterium]